MASAKFGSVMFFTICKTVLQQITNMNFTAFDSKTKTVLQQITNINSTAFDSKTNTWERGDPTVLQ